MKIAATVLFCSALIYANVAASEPIRTITKDLRGTVIEVSVDWNDRTVIAKLRGNPGNLSEAELNERLGVAVWYAAATDCSIRGSQPLTTTQREVSGQLECPWF